MLQTDMIHTRVHTCLADIFLNQKLLLLSIVQALFVVLVD